MNWFRRFMEGRNGVDQLSVALLILSIAIYFVEQITNIRILTFISYIPLVICFYRAFSRNITKRRLENYKFIVFIGPANKRLKETQSRIKNSKIYRYLKCPNCKAKLRVPRGKGKITVTCPKCKTKFDRTV